MQDTTFIWGNLCLCKAGSLFSFFRRQKSLLLFCLTAFATFKPHIAGGGGEEKQTPKTIGGKQSLQLWIRCLFPTALADRSWRFLALGCGWSCAGEAQVRHRWGWAKSALCPEQWGAFNSCPSDTALLFPLLLFVGIISCCGEGSVCSLAVWSPQLYLSFSGYQLLADSYRAAGSREADGAWCQELWQDSNKAISLNSQQNRFHQR